MKKYLPFINLAPFLIWIIWFVCMLVGAPANVSLELILIFAMPIVFSVLNLIFSVDKVNFIESNGIFAAADILGYIFSGMLYYDHISDDSETSLVVGFFTVALIIYIAVITLVCFLIKMFARKIKR